MWSTRSSAVSGSPTHQGDTAWVTVGGHGPPPATGLDGRGRQRPVGGRGRGRGAGAEPPLDDGDDQGDEDPEPGAVASSTSDATVRDAKHASVPLRRVRAGEGRWEKFLYE